MQECMHIHAHGNSHHCSYAAATLGVLVLLVVFVQTSFVVCLVFVPASFMPLLLNSALLAHTDTYVSCECSLRHELPLYATVLVADMCSAAGKSL